MDGVGVNPSNETLNSRAIKTNFALFRVLITSIVIVRRSSMTLYGSGIVK